MARRKREKRDKKQKLYIIVALVFIVLMLVPAWFRGFRGGGGGITQAELKKYLFVPPPSNFTVMLFVASPKECGICPTVASNVTQAVQILKDFVQTHKLNISITYKVFLCEGFPNCKDKEALVNFRVYRVSSVPLLLISYKGLLVPFDPVGIGPQRLAQILLQWYRLMEVAWKPPTKGKYLLYLYDKAHESPYLNTLIEQAKLNNVTVVELGCNSFPTNCTDPKALGTMAVLGVRPNDLPLAIVYKDGRAIAAAKVDQLQGVNEIIQALKN